MTGSKQYLVAEGDVLEVEKVSADKKFNLSPMLVIDDGNVKVGSPHVDGIQVNVEIIQPEVLGEKITAIRYKSKKRVRKTRGHRQRLSQIKIVSIQ